MLINKETEELLNRLLQQLFEGNAIIDNLCYNLQNLSLNGIAKAMHEPVAHKLPEFADHLSDLMDELGARPVRYAIPDHINKYESALDILKEAQSYFLALRNKVSQAIEEEDMEYNAMEVKIFLEDFLLNIVLKFCKQMEEWVKVCESVGTVDFDLHIDRYTHYIK